MMSSGHLPSKRAIAATAKLCGRRLERRWPFLQKANECELNLSYDDLLEFQYARSRGFTALIVGAFDGVTNDPSSRFILEHAKRAIFVEPQPAAFKRLSQNLAGHGNVELVQAAIDERPGFRDLYYVVSGIKELPDWVEQLASFRKEHLLRHESLAPGLARHISSISVPTKSFGNLFEQFGLTSIDLLQIDAEGLDAQLLSWFPFHEVTPALVHYETAHMSDAEHQAVRTLLTKLGYIVRPNEGQNDDMAILF